MFGVPLILAIWILGASSRMLHIAIEEKMYYLLLYYWWTVELADLHLGIAESKLSVG